MSSGRQAFCTLPRELAAWSQYSASTYYSPKVWGFEDTPCPSCSNTSSLAPLLPGSAPALVTYLFTSS